MPRMMGLPSQMCQSVTRVRAGTPGVEDDYGVTQPGTPERRVITGVSLQPLLGAPSTEVMGVDFDQIKDRWRLFAPPGTDLVTTDVIEQGDLILDVDGDPVTWPGVDGSPHHLEAFLVGHRG